MCFVSLYEEHTAAAIRYLHALVYCQKSFRHSVLSRSSKKKIAIVKIDYGINYFTETVYFNIVPTYFFSTKFLYILTFVNVDFIKSFLGLLIYFLLKI